MPHLDYMVLADSAVSVENKHYMLGAGFDAIGALQFPARHAHLSVAARLIVNWNETNQPLGVEVDVLDDDGISIMPSPPGPVRGGLTVGRPPHLPAGSDQSVCLALNLSMLEFARPGTYTVVFRINGLDEGRSTFNVMLLPGMQVQPPEAPA